MADNLNVTEGSGKVIAADDVSSVYYPRFKVSVGADGVAGDATPTNPFPVSDAGPAWTTVRGLTNSEPFTSADQTSGAAAVTAAPVSTQKLVVTDITITNRSAVALILTFTAETSGHVLLRVPVPAKAMFAWSPRGKTKLATADKKLMVQADVAGQFDVLVHHYSEA